MNSPEALFDTLAAVTRLQPILGHVFPSEVHLFLYLSCILSMITDAPASTWGYIFAGTTQGAPYSPDIQNSILELLNDGDLAYQAGTADQRIIATEQGRSEYEILRQFGINQSRDACIASACDSMLALPVSVVRTAIEHEPALRRALARHSSRLLLEEGDVDAIHEQFAALATVLRSIAPEVERQDLLVPAVVWLSYLIRMAEDHGSKPQMELFS